MDLSRDRDDLRRLPEAMRVYVERFCATFRNAEENVARRFCPWVMAVPPIWPQAVFSAQLMDEFKHADFFERYFAEVFGNRSFESGQMHNPIHDSLAARECRLFEVLNGDSEERELRLVEAVTHYHALIEGVQANAGYQIAHDLFARKGLLPGLSEGFRRIRQDEGRHVGFGLRLLRFYIEKDRRYGLRIREMFEEYWPLIRARYGQPMEVNGRTYPPPEEERGVERLAFFYHRRLSGLFG